MVGPNLKILWQCEDNSAGDSERSKMERKTEEAMGRQTLKLRMDENLEIL